MNLTTLLFFIFSEHEIDGRALALVYPCDLKELVKRVGPRVKFRAKLSQLLTSRGMKNNLDPKDTKKSKFIIFSLQTRRKT